MTSGISGRHYGRKALESEELLPGISELPTFTTFIPGVVVSTQCSTAHYPNEFLKQSDWEPLQTAVSRLEPAFSKNPTKNAPFDPFLVSFTNLLSYPQKMYGGGSLRMCPASTVQLFNASIFLPTGKA